MFGFTVEDLCGKSRRRPLVIARQIGMYVFRELTDFSYPRIAEQFGGRDHTTVIHAVEKIKGLMTERHQVFDQVNELMSRIRLGDRWISLWTPGDISPHRWGTSPPVTLPVILERWKRVTTLWIVADHPTWDNSALIHNPQALLPLLQEHLSFSYPGGGR